MLEPQLQSFGSWLLQSTVQAVVLIAVIFLLKALVRDRVSVRWHHAVWILLVARMIMPFGFSQAPILETLIPESARQQAANWIFSDLESFVVTVLVDPQVNAATSTDSSLNGAAGGPFQISTIQLGTALFTVWFIGTFVLAISVFLGSLRLWPAVLRSQSQCNPKLKALLDVCKQRIGVKIPVKIVCTNHIVIPALLGFFRPCLLLPEDLSSTQDDEALTHIFLHELAHLKRRDVLLEWLVTLLQIIHWFNPLVWVAFKRMRHDRESATDGMALSLLNPKKTNNYGKTMINLVERSSSWRLSPSMACVLGGKASIKRRIVMISKFQQKTYRWSPTAVILLVLVGCASLTDSGLSLDESANEKADSSLYEPPGPSDEARRAESAKEEGQQNDSLTFENEKIHFFKNASARAERLAAITNLRSNNPDRRKLGDNHQSTEALSADDKEYLTGIMMTYGSPIKTCLDRLKASGSYVGNKLPKSFDIVVIATSEPELGGVVADVTISNSSPLHDYADFTKCVEDTYINLAFLDLAHSGTVDLPITIVIKDVNI